MGDSRGRWEGDSLVVDVTKFTGDTWFDRAGNFHSNALHVVERYTPTGPDHLLYEATIDDPTVFTRPWKMSMPLYRRKDAGAQILENECYALARDPARLATLAQVLRTRGRDSALFDTPAYVRHLEAAFAAMHARRRAGLPPAAIEVARR